MINRLKKIVCSIKNAIFVIGVGFLFYQLVIPYFLYKLDYKNAEKLAGWEKKSIRIDNEVISYVERGKGETIFLIHGFANDKKFWAPYMNIIGDNYHFIAIDLPGHGDSSPSKKYTFDLFSLADAIENFAKHNNLESFHVVGSSLGGGVSLAYASKYPNRVKSVVVFNPFGVHPRVINDFHRRVVSGENVFFPENAAQLDELSSYSIGRKMNINPTIKALFVNYLKTKYSDLKPSCKEMLATTTLEEYLPNIKAHVLMFVGKKDKLVDPTTAAVYYENLPDVEKIEINGGHVLVDDGFKEMSPHLRDYFNK